MSAQVWASNYIGHVQFFLTRLLVLTHDQISKLVDDMDAETNSIRQEALKVAWYMRGGVSYDQALQLSTAERTNISELIKDNLETTKKTGLPFF